MERGADEMSWAGSKGKVLRVRGSHWRALCRGNWFGLLEDPCSCDMKKGLGEEWKQKVQ